VKVHGDRLRAQARPLEAKLVVESNGGTFTVTVRAEVPVKPFPLGPFAGARSIREVAQKSQAHPKEAAPLFESGEGEQWYADNGWTSPVTIPTMSGLAALQQFFEALGMARAPRVGISATELALEGNPGEKLRCSLEVKSQEKKPVYAHATSNV